MTNRFYWGCLVFVLILISAGQETLHAGRGKAKQPSPAQNEDAETTYCCDICLETLPNSTKKTLPCGHSFCANCIARWLTAPANTYLTCPMRCQQSPLQWNEQELGAAIKRLNALRKKAKTSIDATLFAARLVLVEAQLSPSTFLNAALFFGRSVMAVSQSAEMHRLNNKLIFDAAEHILLKSTKLSVSYRLPAATGLLLCLTISDSFKPSVKLLDELTLTAEKTPERLKRGPRRQLGTLASEILTLCQSRS